MNMIGKTIELNSVEQELCGRLAKERHQVNRRGGVKNSKIGDQSDEFTDMEGMSAELAFCKMFNIYPDLFIQITSSKQGKDFGDAILDGKKVDVKATKYQTGKLLAVPWKKPTVDAFALMIGQCPKYTFRGFIGADEFLSDKFLRELNGKKTYLAYQEELKEWESI